MWWLLDAERCMSSTKKMTVRPRSSGSAAPPGVGPPAAPPPRAAASCASSFIVPALMRSKKAMGCGLPSTFSSNCAGASPSTNLPDLSKTITSVCTSSELMRTISSSSSLAVVAGAVVVVVVAGVCCGCAGACCV